MATINITIPDEHWTAFYEGFVEIHPPGNWGGTEVKWVEYVMASDLFATAEAGKQGKAHRNAELDPAAVTRPEKQVKAKEMGK